MQGFIYKITNLVNNKIYIGQTIQNPINRWYRHCQVKCLSKNERNMAIKRAIFKYGKECFKFEVIETLNNCSRQLLDDREVYWINYYNSYNTGYNCTKGGTGGARLLKITSAEHNNIIELYNDGFSLREIAKEYNVDKATIKHILDINNITQRVTRTYKFSKNDRERILSFYLSILDIYGCTLSRHITKNRFKISKSYLSQLING